MFRPEFELFNISTDSSESNNLASDDSYKNILEFMKAKMKDFQHKTKDPWLIIWEHYSSLQGTGVNL